MAADFKIFTVKDVPVKLHWSFLLIPLILIYLALINDLSLSHFINLFILLALLFICVLIHELAHAIVAGYLNINARDILLSPIGGLARLESLEAYPKKEILIASAGPAANLLLALMSLSLLKLRSSEIYYSLDNWISIDLSMGSVLNYLLIINVILCFLNLIPAFPMDGGRVMRAVLSLKYENHKASYIAITISKVLALTFMVYGAMTSLYIVVFISMLVWFMAMRELKVLLMRKETMIQARGIKKAGPSFPPTNRPEEDLNT